MSDALNEWLVWIEAQHPQVIELGLERINKVAQPLGLNKFSCPVITVAGTNGKGSCVAMLQALYQRAGLRTAVYTSLHLIDFNERLMIDAETIDDASLCEAFSIIKSVSNNINLSFFEFTTLAILWLIQRAEPDVVILEIGLGGRLDAVNIVEPNVAVITSIAMDHEAWLGSDREAVGFEKAGIIREKVPVVCGDLDPPQSVIDRATELNAPLYLIGRDFSFEEQVAGWTFRCEEYELNDLVKPMIKLDNAASALMVYRIASRCCSGLRSAGADLIPATSDTFNVARISVSDSEHVIREAVAQRHLLRGRQQVLQTSIPTIVDVAHNPASTAYLADQLDQLLPAQGTTFAIVGMLSDKDLANSFKPLLNKIDRWYVCDLPTKRAEKSENIQQTLQDLGVQRCYTRADVATAWQDVMSKVAKQDRIVVFGSFHTVGAVMSIFKESKQ